MDGSGKTEHKPNQIALPSQKNLGWNKKLKRVKELVRTGNLSLAIFFYIFIKWYNGFCP